MKIHLRLSTIYSLANHCSKGKPPLIAANIDTAVIIQSLDSNFNLRRLERYLVMVNEDNIIPSIFLSKSDLIGIGEAEEKKNDICKIFPNIRIETFINNNVTDIEK